MAFKQYREIQAPGISVKDADMKYTVEVTKKGNKKFEATIFNLSDDGSPNSSSTWANFEKDGLVKILGGFKDGIKGPLIKGKIKSTNKKFNGEDYEYEITGIDASLAGLQTGISKSFKDPNDIADIVRQIASELGYTPKVEKVGFAPKKFAVEKDVKITKELDNLSQMAAENTSTRWEWEFANGKLYFRPLSVTNNTTVTIGYRQGLLNIARVQDSSEEKSNNSERLEFEMLQDPRLKKGDAVTVLPQSFQGVWKLESFKHETDTDSGDHVTSGRLLSTQKEYTIEDVSLA